MNLESIKFCFYSLNFKHFFEHIYNRIKINQGNRLRVTNPLYYHGDNEITTIT